MGPDEEQRPYRIKRETRSHGRSTITFDCPFCGAETIAYLWSLAGSGKRCKCGAMHVRNAFGEVSIRSALKGQR